MEKELLRKFEIASEDEDDIDFDMMNQIAQILFEYNEGINVIQTFVIKNDIVIENEEVVGRTGVGVVGGFAEVRF